MSDRVRDGARWVLAFDAEGAGLALPLRSALALSLVGALGVVLAAIVWHTLLDDYGVRNVTAGTLGLATAIALVVARFRPRAAWWLSLTAAVAATVTSHAELDGMVWPAPVLVAHVAVLGLVGFGAPHVMLAEMWLGTLAAGIVLGAGLPGEQALVSLMDMSLLSGMVLITVGALGGHRDALRRVALADQKALAEQTRSALLAERARIARELHDVVAHHMSVVAVQAEAAPYRVSDPPPELARSFATIRSSAVEALTELHRILDLLRNGTDEASPQPTLDRLGELVGRLRAAGTPVTMRVDGERRALPPGVELSAYRIVQEALSNALQHAPGARVGIEVTYKPGDLHIRVDNDPPPHPPP
ncbi:sensor histidine kinase, partial [Nonomuraea sp. K271]